MISHRKSLADRQGPVGIYQGSRVRFLGKYGKGVFTLLLSSAILSSCVSRSVDSSEPENSSAEEVSSVESAANSETSSELSLREDRSQLDELRREIPEERKKENDELAKVLNLMEEYRQPPAEIRRRFDRVMRQRRDRFNKGMRKERDAFNRQERRDRDDFIADLKDRREQLRDRKLTREQAKDLRDRLNDQRDDFFSEAKDNRKEFESDFQARRKDFDDQYREVRRDFSDQLRAYTKGYYDYQKGLRLKKQAKDKEAKMRRQGNLPAFSVNSSGQQELDEFELMKTKPATTLRAGESDE